MLNYVNTPSENPQPSHHHALILQELISDVSLWQVHNCRLTQAMAKFDTPQSLLAHYNSLDDDTQATHPLSFEQLRHLNDIMTRDQAACLIGVSPSAIKGAWQVKYIGRVVFFCETIKLAIRLHFSNTAKPAQAVYADSQDTAWQSQAKHWAVFGVVDILYKGKDTLGSMADNFLQITPSLNYQALPSKHSLSVLSLINDHQRAFFWLTQAIEACLSAWVFDDDTSV